MQGQQDYACCERQLPASLFAEAPLPPVGDELPVAAAGTAAGAAGLAAAVAAAGGEGDEAEGDATEAAGAAAGAFLIIAA